MAAAKRHRHVVEVVEEKPVVLVEDKPVEMLQPEVTVDTTLPASDIGLLGVNIEQSTSSGGMSKLMWVVIIIVVAGMVTGAWLVWQINHDKQILGGPTPTPSVNVETVTPSPEVSPTPEIKPEEVKIRVLNASGIKGEAAKVADILEEGGFTDIETGNATTFSLKLSTVSFKKSVEGAMATIYKLLDGKVIFEEDKTVLEEDGDFDVVINVAKSDFE